MGQVIETPSSEHDIQTLNQIQQSLQAKAEQFYNFVTSELQNSKYIPAHKILSHTLQIRSSISQGSDIINDVMGVAQNFIDKDYSKAIGNSVSLALKTLLGSSSASVSEKKQYSVGVGLLGGIVRVDYYIYIKNFQYKGFLTKMKNMVLYAAVISSCKTDGLSENDIKALIDLNYGVNLTLQQKENLYNHARDPIRSYQKDMQQKKNQGNVPNNLRSDSVLYKPKYSLQSIESVCQQLTPTSFHYLSVAYFLKKDTKPDTKTSKSRLLFLDPHTKQTQQQLILQILKNTKNQQYQQNLVYKFVIYLIKQKQNQQPDNKEKDKEKGQKQKQKQKQDERYEIWLRTKSQLIAAQKLGLNIYLIGFSEEQFQKLKDDTQDNKNKNVALQKNFYNHIQDQLKNLKQDFLNIVGSDFQFQYDFLVFNDGQGQWVKINRESKNILIFSSKNKMENVEQQKQRKLYKNIYLIPKISRDQSKLQNYKLQKSNQILIEIAITDDQIYLITKSLIEEWQKNFNKQYNSPAFKYLLIEIFTALADKSFEGKQVYFNQDNQNIGFAISFDDWLTIVPRIQQNNDKEQKIAHKRRKRRSIHGINYVAAHEGLYTANSRLRIQEGKDQQEQLDKTWKVSNFQRKYVSDQVMMVHNNLRSKARNFLKTYTKILYNTKRSYTNPRKIESFLAQFVKNSQILQKCTTKTLTFSLLLQQLEKLSSISMKIDKKDIQDIKQKLSKNPDWKHPFIIYPTALYPYISQNLQKKSETSLKKLTSLESTPHCFNILYRLQKNLLFLKPIGGQVYRGESYKNIFDFRKEHRLEKGSLIQFTMPVCVVKRKQIAEGFMRKNKDHLVRVMVTYISDCVRDVQGMSGNPDQFAGIISGNYIAKLVNFQYNINFQSAQRQIVINLLYEIIPVPLNITKNLIIELNTSLYSTSHNLQQKQFGETKSQIIRFHSLQNLLIILDKKYENNHSSKTIQNEIGDIDSVNVNNNANDNDDYQIKINVMVFQDKIKENKEDVERLLKWILEKEIRAVVRIIGKSDLLDDFRNFLREYLIIVNIQLCDSETMRVYAYLKSQMEKKGKFHLIYE